MNDDLTTRINETFTRDGLEALARDHEIPLPAGWTKMSFDRKQRALATAVAKANKPGAFKRLGEAMTNTVAAISEFGKGLRAANKHIDAAFATDATMPKDLNWRRRTHADWKIRIIAGSKDAADPVPMTRQVARANKRWNDKRMLSNLKKDAAGRSGPPGGPAAVTMRDVEVVRQGLRERIEQSA